MEYSELSSVFQKIFELFWRANHFPILARCVPLNSRVPRNSNSCLDHPATRTTIGTESDAHSPQPGLNPLIPQTLDALLRLPDMLHLVQKLRPATRILARFARLLGQVSLTRNLGVLGCIRSASSVVPEFR